LLGADINVQAEWAEPEELTDVQQEQQGETLDEPELPREPEEPLDVLEQELDVQQEQHDVQEEQARHRDHHNRHW
jgi:vacuolar-type H+-ATPase subunit I/STV1